MLAMTAQMAANTSNRVRLNEIIAKIDEYAKNGRYSGVFYISPHNTDQTLFVKKELEKMEFFIIASPYKHKLFISWEPAAIKKSVLWYLRRASQLFDLYM